MIRLQEVSDKVVSKAIRLARIKAKGHMNAADIVSKRGTNLKDFDKTMNQVQRIKNEGKFNQYRSLALEAKMARKKKRLKFGQRKQESQKTDKEGENKNIKLALGKAVKEKGKFGTRQIVQVIPISDKLIFVFTQ